MMVPVSHTCHAEGCSVALPPRMFACIRHWKMVPVPLQSVLWGVYRQGQEIDKWPSGDYLAIQAACRWVIAEQEGKTSPALAADVASKWRGLLDDESVDVGLDDNGIIKALFEAMPHWKKKP